MSAPRRSSREIRASLAETRRRLDEEMEELEVRVHESFNPRELALRHPALLGAAGLVVGLILLRKPALLFRGLAGIAKMGAPLLLKGILPKD